MHGVEIVQPYYIFWICVQTYKIKLILFRAINRDKFKVTMSTKVCSASAKL